MTIYVVKCAFFRQSFWTSNFDSSSFLSQLRQERVIYLKRKPYNPLFESNFEAGRIPIIKGSRPVLVKRCFFDQVGIASSRTIPRTVSQMILNALCEGFKMRYHLFLNSIWYLYTRSKLFAENCLYEDTYICPPVYSCENSLTNGYLISPMKIRSL